eukprot:Pompholyxophrys_punicea_v1_NODE_1050_length_1012_cov_8.280042.p1 type:complete len:163 gc:universal NODE_1050_length_1012_cov_8.280042:292-780(+)
MWRKRQKISPRSGTLCAGDTMLENDDYARLKDGRLFLQYNFTYADKDDDTLKRMLVWIHSRLKSLLKYAIPAFLDGTFKCVPKPFTQCMVLMVFDEASDLYIPVVYGLLQDKKEWSYWNFLHLVIVSSDVKFNPPTIRVDFEKGEIGALKDQFPDSNKFFEQ